MSVLENLAMDSSDTQGLLEALQRDVNKAEALTVVAGVAIANAAGVTWTAAQMLAGIILRSGAAGVSDTTATAALIVAAIPHAAVGSAFEITVRNANTGTLTIVAGAGVTLAGTTTIPTVNTRGYLVQVTNATLTTEAVTITGLYVAAN